MAETARRRGGVRKRVVEEEIEDDQELTTSIREQVAERQQQRQQQKRDQALRAQLVAAGLKKLDEAQAAGLSQRETNEVMDTYVREQVEGKGAGEEHMAAWIREQMRKRLGQTEDEAKASSSQLHPDDELYAVPADLQGKSTKALDPGAWATGIVEVALPVEYKMRNIEETEAAKRQLLHATRGTNDEPQNSVPTASARRGMYPAGFGRLTPLTAPPEANDSYVADQMRAEARNVKRKKKRTM